MITENISTLNIHKLSKEQYERELATGNIDPYAIYLTPDEEVDLSEYATLDYVDNKIAAIPKVDISGKADKSYVDSQDSSTLIAAKSYTNTEIANISALVGDTAVSTQIDTALTEAKSYTDEQIAAIPTPSLIVTDDGDGNLTIALG